MGHDAKCAAKERVEGIDDSDRQDLSILAVLTGRRIKKIPRLTAFPDWSRRASAKTP